MQRLVSVLDARRPETGLHLIGITGGVAAGKSTLSGALSRALADPSRDDVPIVTTDSFLLPNATLEARGLTMEKGFPASYDVDALRAALRALAAGERVVVPTYSHRTYDIDTDRPHAVDPAPIVLVEGLHLGRFAGDLLGTVLYLDAAEADVERWYVQRFLQLVAAAEADPASFYRLFLGPGPDELSVIARHLWATINLVNLREHIAPWRSHADVVVRVDGDHRITDVVEQERGEPLPL